MKENFKNHKIELIHGYFLRTMFSDNNGGHNQGTNPEDPLNKIVSEARNLLSRGKFI